MESTILRIELNRVKSEKQILESKILEYRNYLLNLIGSEHIEEIIKSGVFREQMLKDFDNHFNLKINASRD